MSSVAKPCIMTSRQAQTGMMLLEVLVSVLIFSIGVLGMVMMQSVSSANSINSEDRTMAALLANDLISEMWTLYNPATPTSISAPSDYSTWQTRVSDPSKSHLRSATGTLTITAGNTANIVIQWTPQGRSDASLAYYKTQVVIQ